MTNMQGAVGAAVGPTSLLAAPIQGSIGRSQNRLQDALYCHLRSYEVSRVADSVPAGSSCESGLLNPDLGIKIRLGSDPVFKILSDLISVFNYIDFFVDR